MIVDTRPRAAASVHADAAFSCRRLFLWRLRRFRGRRRAYIAARALALLHTRAFAASSPEKFTPFECRARASAAIATRIAAPRSRPLSPSLFSVHTI